MKITEQVADLSRRVSALEGKDLDDAASIARIEKVFGNVRISMIVTTTIHQYHVCGESTLCSESLII